MLAIGDTAPDFTAPTNDAGSITLSDLPPRSVVLYFYPKDDTPGCTKEAIAFTAMIADFEAANCTVLGVSKDTVAKHDKFRAKHALDVVLVSDEATTICEDYGVWVEKNMYGKKYMGIERATYLIGPDGKVAQIWRKVKVPGHAEAVLEAVQGL
ncbi:thioredoxin-dependent thiol peroxidase [Algirhabdus cladophorae]|uniref:thioredoxin-dependent thiol peroxidase n=1 Tax=Algirhabdus cladophorae TaxID=3377108 RepID=UPI003B8475D6